MYQGATPRELVLEAARRDNVDLLKGLIDTLWKEPISDSKKSDANVKKAKERVAELINTAFDPIGNHALHLAAKNGNCKSRSGPAIGPSSRRSELRLTRV